MRLRRKHWRLTWISLGLGTLVMVRLAKSDPLMVERVYGDNIYPAVRTVFAHSTWYLPVPAIWVIAVGLIILFWYTAIRPLRRGRVGLVSAFAGILSASGALIFFFYLLWGFNYYRPSVIERLKLESRGIGEVEVRREFERASDELFGHIQGMEFNSGAMPDWSDRHYRDEALAVVGPVMHEFNYPVPARVRGRVFKPNGILLVLNTAGIYIPFSGEGHIDGGLLPIQQPFTMAHELAHGYGVTDEGECNFIAYLACRNSADDFVRLSGLLSYWRYTASEFRAFFPVEYKARYLDFPPELIAMLEAIHANNARYPELMPRLRNTIYDSYLKSHGVSDGLKSYNRVVVLSSDYFADRQNPQGSE